VWLKDSSHSPRTLPQPWSLVVCIPLLEASSTTVMNESRFFVSVIDGLESTIRPQQDQGALTKQAIARSDHCGFCFLLLIGEGNRRILLKRSSLIGRKTPISALDPDPPPPSPLPLTRFCFAGFSTPIRESSGVPSFATQKVSERREGPTTTIAIMKRKLVDENSSTECGHYSPKGIPKGIALISVKACSE